MALAILGAFIIPGGSNNNPNAYNFETQAIKVSRKGLTDPKWKNKFEKVERLVLLMVIANAENLQVLQLAKQQASLEYKRTNDDIFKLVQSKVDHNILLMEKFKRLPQRD